MSYTYAGVSGDYKKTLNFLNKIKKIDEGSVERILKEYGKLGVTVLSQNTPKKTGRTASSWTYEIVRDADKIVLYWCNSNVINHVNIAIIVQYGHATRNGGYVQGRDYINPALRPIFDKMSIEIGKAVTTL